jgi:hypothetical protein
MRFLTDRDLGLLRQLRHHKFLDIAQMTELVMPGSGNTRVVRERMNRLSAAGLAKKANQKLVNQEQTALKRVYVPTLSGCIELARRAGDPSLLLDCEPPAQQWMFFDHYLAVSDFHVALDRAFAAQALVGLGAHYLEHDLIAPQRRLFTVVDDLKRTVCVPDFAFELSAGPYRRAYYLELERGTDSPQRVAAKKTPGYRGLLTSRRFETHFPQAADFRVLCVAPTPTWRDRLREAVSKYAGAELWLFVSSADVTADERLLFGNVVYTCTEGPRPLVRREAVEGLSRGAACDTPSAVRSAECKA